MSRVDQFATTLTVDWPGLGALGKWDRRQGGQMDSQSTKFRPGGMGAQISLGGVRDMQNITLERLYKIDRDHAVIKTLYSAAGRARCTVTEQPLDTDGHPTGDTVTWTGVLKRVAMPDRDSEQQAAAMLSVEIDTEGTIA